jgi:arginase
VVSSKQKNSLNALKKQSCYISQFVQQQIEDKQQFLILGGDHSCAVGTWAGVLNGLPTDASFALIWIDAHMDANTLATSPSGNLHGMPVSLILGDAEHELQLCSPAQRHIIGSDLYMTGIRSYEADELILLSKHKVNVFEMARLEQQGGISSVLKELVDSISRCYDFFAISLDLDAIDPRDAPGVETPVPNGIASAELLAALEKINFSDNFLGLEIAEFDPATDVSQKTEKLVFDIISAVYAG